jgi:pimeloyl-ACP methyl ester carboxylesterase
MESVHLPGLVLGDHEFQVPLDYEKPHGEQITIFAREVAAPGMESQCLPWMLFLQGGPGFPAPRPEDRSTWLIRALQDYRLLLLDQRGTGRSTPVNYQTLRRFPDGEAQADYLKHFRSDSIIRDAERIRLEMLGEAKQWSLLGQSYGGFCIAHYLSAYPESIREAIFTGGLPAIGPSIDQVYRATYKRVIEQNRRYYDRYPGDEKRVREIADYLLSHTVELPGGGVLSARRFQQLGMNFGARNGFEIIHYLLEGAFVHSGLGKELNFSFLREIEHLQKFETNPIYVLLHEAIYCEGYASDWSAERVRAEYPEFSFDPDRPVYFTGEMIYPWMFEDYHYLRPLKDAAEILASYEGWPLLYEVDRLRANTVPCVAAVYYDDMYVERRFSEQTAHTIKGTRVWLTNEYDHSALRLSGERVLDRLLLMLKGEV